jgi:hypothetical protein
MLFQKPRGACPDLFRRGAAVTMQRHVAGGDAMFCPKCGSEFEEGYTRCAECETDLVESLPTDEEEYTELVTVYEGDEESASVVRGALGSAGIEAWIEGEATLNVFPNLSPVALRVRAEDADAALELLAQVDECPPLEEEEEPGEQS